MRQHPNLQLGQGVQAQDMGLGNNTCVYFA